MSTEAKPAAMQMQKIERALKEARIGALSNRASGLPMHEPFLDHLLSLIDEGISAARAMQVQMEGQEAPATEAQKLHTLPLPEQDAESFVRMLLWDEFPECCGQPCVGAEYMGQQEMVCCGCPEPALLSDAQIVASLRERFPEVAAAPIQQAPKPEALEAAPSTQQFPEGFRLLPIEATDSMCDADWDVSMSDAHSNGGVSSAAWRAMVEAAPQVTCGNGHSGHGWYMHDTDYPEEGAVFLGPVVSGVAAPAGATEAMVDAAHALDPCTPREDVRAMLEAALAVAAPAGGTAGVPPSDGGQSNG